MTARDDALAILNGEHPERSAASFDFANAPLRTRGAQSKGRLPVFSGLPSLTVPGLNAAGVRYSQAHTDAQRMARAAASTYELFGFESAVVPFDLCVEAETLGCEIDFQEEEAGVYLAPTVSGPLSVDLDPERVLTQPERSTRIPRVCAALDELKNTVGAHIIIGAWIPGPFTLAWQLFGADAWLTLTQQNPARAKLWLTSLTPFLAHTAARYRASGADFLSIHEMGGSPQVIGPATFRALVQPALTHLLTALPSPRVLSVCGDTNAVIADLAACGAEALSVDHRCDLARARHTLGPRATLLGNFDPVGLLGRGTPEAIVAAVQRIAPHVNALWPGCDLSPDTPAENMRALITAAQNVRAKHSPETGQ
jgi:[methyl-Co(III) methanol-specific corrinoid protein]:coenzyme M methyltransferase